jgi:hypothetical protein
MSYTLSYKRGSFPMSENFESLDQAVLRGQAVVQQYQAYGVSIMKETSLVMSQAEILLGGIDPDQTVIFSSRESGAGSR